MDDLSGLDWTSSQNDTRKPPTMSSGLQFPHSRQINLSGRSTPLSYSSGQSNPPSKPATPANDSFASLVSFGGGNANKNISLVEQQKRLQEERARKEAEKRSQFEAQYGAQNAQFWNNLEQSGAGRRSGLSSPPMQQSAQNGDDDDDLLAAFNSSAPVDASSHLPVPNATPSPDHQTHAHSTTATSHGGESTLFDDDDDPFGLRRLKSQPAPTRRPAQHNDDDNGDDDFLGDLSKPVSEFPRTESRGPTSLPTDREEQNVPDHADSVDRAIAELVDMGFPVEKAREALSSTTSGTDVQAAVGWLLTQAHEDARQRANGRSTVSADRTGRLEGSRERDEHRTRHPPSDLRRDLSGSSATRISSQGHVQGDVDAAKLASNFGNNLLKTANTLWKTGSRKMQQVVQDLNAETETNQPRWMRATPGPGTDSSVSRGEIEQTSQRVGPTPGALTDEALLLESGAARPSRSAGRQRDSPAIMDRSTAHKPSQAVNDRATQQHLAPRTQHRIDAGDPKSRAFKTAVEEQSAQAYVSPARRRKPAAQPSAPEQTFDLLESSDRPVDKGKSQMPSSRTPTQAKSLPSRPKAPSRKVPEVSQTALASTQRYREKGVEAYRRGDYAVAHEAFTSALRMLPDGHPMTIVIRSNRAMTALKTGEPKSAIDDADTILTIIGPSRGEGETIEIGNGEPNKQMKDFFGKALMRKAEALEQLERWADAAQAWRQAVEAGHGGSISIQGRNRCEQATGISKPPPKPVAPARQSKHVPKPKKASAMEDLAGPSVLSSASDFEAVNRLRAANEAAERLDEERFNLADSVDARVVAWKSGKQDNLRGLLASLDTVLWPEAGWKKINLSELVLPNKVKIQYMKGIAKVHPDKIPTNATTEQRMIAGAVFATLNEAWDKFKKENNL